MLADGWVISEDPRCLLAVSDERDQQLRLRLAAWQEGWEACAQTLAVSEYQRGHDDADAEWMAALSPARMLAGRLDPAEFERRRWTVRGEQRTRETFGQPHPADFPGVAA